MAPGTRDRTRRIPWWKVVRFHREITARSEENFFAFDVRKKDDPRWVRLPTGVIADLAGPWSCDEGAIGNEKFLREQRQQEGEKLAALIQQRSDAMRGHLATLRQQLPALQAAHRQRLLDRLQSLDIEAEPMRLEEEIVYVLQRADVEEEMDRLDAHLDAIESALESTAPVGRRLDFLMQELNREANTLGSKSTALSTTNVSVEFKVLIEQMREQIQNIE